MPADKFRVDILEIRDELKKAEYALSVRRYDLAIELLHSMLKEHPENSAVFYTLARVYLSQEKLIEASHAVRESLRLDPLAGQAHTLYGNILASMGKLNAAESEYQRSLEVQPDVAYTHYMYAALLVDKRRDFARASLYAHNALELDPAAAAHHVTLAKILAMQDHLNEADSEFLHALSLDPESVLVCRVYGWFMLYKRNQPEQAFEYLRRAMRIDPNDAQTRKIFIIACKARLRAYRPIWTFSFLLYRAGRPGQAIFLLSLLILIFAQRVFSTLWDGYPLYDTVQGIFTVFIFILCFYVLILEVVLNRMIKNGYLK